MNLIDEMLSLDLLSTQQHREIGAWVRAARTPEAILAMPPHLWRALEAASLAMNIDADSSTGVVRSSRHPATAVDESDWPALRPCLHGAMGPVT